MVGGADADTLDGNGGGDVLIGGSGEGVYTRKLKRDTVIDGPPSRRRSTSKGFASINPGTEGALGVDDVQIRPWLGNFIEGVLGTPTELSRQLLPALPVNVPVVAPPLPPRQD